MIASVNYTRVTLLLTQKFFFEAGLFESNAREDFLLPRVCVYLICRNIHELFKEKTVMKKSSILSRHLCLADVEPMAASFSLRVTKFFLAVLCLLERASC